MSNALQQLREELQRQQGGNNTSRPSGGDNALFRFWDAPVGSTTSLRFLPDADTSNPKFWVERQMITLTFNGVVGDESQNGKEIRVQVPCMKMYDHTLHCPVRAEINKYWKTDLEDIARKYWPKRTYLMQGFVRSSDIKEEESPENPIRRFNVNKTLFKNIEQGVFDPDMENLPTDYYNGTDFRVMKTQQGEYANYTTSSFARKESALTEDELAAIEKHGLYNLRDFLPNRPDENGVAIIEEMFFASLDGQAYDPYRWAEFFRPYGMNFDNVPASKPAPSSTPAPGPAQPAPAQSAPVQESQSAPEPQASTGDNNTDDILAQLKSRINGGS